MRTASPLLLIFCLFFDIMPFPALAATFHRPAFRRMLIKGDDFEFRLEYDKGEKESGKNVEEYARIITTIARVIREEKDELKDVYPVYLCGRKIMGKLQTRRSSRDNDDSCFPSGRGLTFINDPEAMAREGTETWIRRQVRYRLVQLSLFRLAVRHGSFVDKALCLRLFPLWLVLGLSCLESQAWNPEKMAAVISAVRSDRLLPLQEYRYLKSFTDLERFEAAQQAQAFCQWLSEVVGKERLIELIRRFSASPLHFGRIFRSVTGMSTAQAQERFRKEIRQFADSGPGDILQPSPLLRSSGRIGKPYPSPNGKLIAFWSNQNNPRSALGSLFITNYNGSATRFAVSNVAKSVAWTPDMKGLFCIRKIVRLGKAYEQLCWVPCRSLRKDSIFTHGLKFRTLLRDTGLSEVAVSPDGEYLALLRQLPGGGRLLLYRLGKGPRLSLVKNTPLPGCDMHFTDSSHIVRLRRARGLSIIVLHNIHTGKEKNLLFVPEPILDLDVSGSQLFFTISWAQDRGVALRCLDLLPSNADTGASQQGQASVHHPDLRHSDADTPTLLVIPSGGFRFSLLPLGRHLVYTSIQNGYFTICKRPIPPRSHPGKSSESTKISLYDAERPGIADDELYSEDSNGAMDDFSFKLPTPVSVVDASFTTFTVTPMKLQWRSLKLWPIIDDNEWGIEADLSTSLPQKRFQAAAWRDTEFDRDNWQLRYQQQQNYNPLWWFGAYDCTTEDYLDVFPMSVYSNQAFFRGFSFGLTFNIASRETLKLSLEFKKNEYLPEFFDGPVPPDLDASNNMYRLLYTWDLRDRGSAPSANPAGRRLVRLFWGDSPSSLKSDIRYREFIADWREYLRAGPSGSHTLALRLLGGTRKTHGSGDAYPIQFVIGGNRTLRGVESYALKGRNFAVANVEYRFPLMERRQAESYFSLLKSPSFRNLLYFDTIHLALFADAGTASDDNLDTDNLERGVGFELRATSSVSGFDPFVMRLGFASGLDDHGEDTVYFVTTSVW